MQNRYTCDRRWTRREWVAGVMLLAGCGKREEMKFYTLRGEVIRINAADHTATVKHEEIPGFMEAMTMEFPVKQPNELARMAPGQKIRATLVQKPESLEYWIEGITVEN